MGGDLSQMVLIHGNIRQQYLPFVLKPESNINANIKDDHDLTDGPQFFSFRNKNEDEYKAGFGRLNICPSVMRSPEFGMLFNKDISNRLLYDHESKDRITIDSFLNQLPGLQIREFQVDSKLDQFINLFAELFKSAKGLFKEFSIKDMIGMGISGIGSGEAGSRWFSMFKEIMSTCWNYCMSSGEYATGNNKPNLMHDAQGKSIWNNFSIKADSAINAVNNASIAPGMDTLIMNFPYMMYYRLQSCTSLNIYELPLIIDKLYSSNGSQGWVGAENKMGISDLAGGGGGGGGGEKSMMSKLLNMVTGGFGDIIDRAAINYMPRWDVKKISGDADGISIKFDLFNDTLDAAIKNFIFVNTIIPNNLWMQYGMFRHSPCLYDVKVEGFKRMFACAGEFSVTANGLIRTPSQEFVRKLCFQHANNGNSTKNAGSWNSESFFNDIKNHGLIKIPDVYTVDMNFKSLIPLTFNNFLFNYSKNSHMEIYTNQNAHHPSTIGETLNSIKSDLGNEIEKVISKGNSDIAEIRKKEKEAEEKKKEEQKKNLKNKIKDKTDKLKKQFKDKFKKQK